MPSVMVANCYLKFEMSHHLLLRTLPALQANYGKKEEVHVHAIKALFKELELEKVFLDYEAASHSALTSTIEEQTLLPKEVFTSLLSKIYKRQK